MAFMTPKENDQYNKGYKYTQANYGVQPYTLPSWRPDQYGTGPNPGGTQVWSQTHGGWYDPADYARALQEAQQARSAGPPDYESIYKSVGGGTGEAPTYTPYAGTLDLPEYTAPEYDEGRIKKLTAMGAGAGLRALRSQVQAAASKTYKNPTQKRMTLRDALAGYGQGIGSVLAGARAGAVSEYNTEYGIAADTAKTRYQAESTEKKAAYETGVAENQRSYQSAWQTWNAYREQKNKEAEMKYSSEYNKWKARYGS